MNNADLIYFYAMAKLAESGKIPQDKALSKIAERASLVLGDSLSAEFEHYIANS